MKVVLFCHSLLSSWNHGNAHFLRGVVSDLRRRGNRVSVYEPRDAWSVSNLEREVGRLPIDELDAVYPGLAVKAGGILRYDLDQLDLDEALDGADLVLVHEWSAPELVARIGRHRARRGRYVLLFHDTHHRSVTAPHEMRRYDLSSYDGVLAFGDAVRSIYEAEGWGRRAWTWHEAADPEVFAPTSAEREGQLVWIGNWGDDERAAELQEFLVQPAARLGLTGSVYGVRYPTDAIEALEQAGLRYRGWLPNHRVPEVFGRHALTVHVPRRPYAEALPGIPTIRMFEALACGIPLISAPWDDTEGLFNAGEDYLVARDGDEMERQMAAVLEDPTLADALSRRGRQTVLARHTCAHRVDELLLIVSAIAGPVEESVS